MQRIYGFICAHSRTAALAVVVILGAEAAFIGWQKAQYDEFMGSLLTPGALAEGVLAVGDRMDDGIFSRRDRVHFTIASSLFPTTLQLRRSRLTLMSRPTLAPLA